MTQNMEDHLHHQQHVRKTDSKGTPDAAQTLVALSGGRLAREQEAMMMLMKEGRRR